VSQKPVAGQVATLAVLAALGVLSLGGAAWSVATSPKVFDVQLHDAAANTAAASSFVANLDLVLTVSGNAGSLSGAAGSPSAEREVLTLRGTLDYQAPNRVHVIESLSSVPGSALSFHESEVTQIGSSCWQESPARQSGTSATTTCNPKALANFLQFLHALGGTTHVSNRGGTFYLAHRDGLRFLTAALPSVLAGGQFSGSVTNNVSVAARISGSTISWEHVHFNGSVSGGATATGGSSSNIQESLDLVITYGQIDSAPAVPQPAGPPTATG